MNEHEISEEEMVLLEMERREHVKELRRERLIETQCKIIGWMILLISLAVLAMIAFNSE